MAPNLFKCVHLGRQFQSISNTLGPHFTLCTHSANWRRPTAAQACGRPNLGCGMGAKEQRAAQSRNENEGSAREFVSGAGPILAQEELLQLLPRSQALAKTTQLLPRPCSFWLDLVARRPQTVSRLGRPVGSSGSLGRRRKWLLPGGWLLAGPPKSQLMRARRLCAAQDWLLAAACWRPLCRGEGQPFSWHEF